MAHQALEESLSREEETTINRQEKKTPQKKEMSQEADYLI